MRKLALVSSALATSQALELHENNWLEDILTKNPSRAPNLSEVSQSIPSITARSTSTLSTPSSVGNWRNEYNMNRLQRTV